MEVEEVRHADAHQTRSPYAPSGAADQAAGRENVRRPLYHVRPAVRGRPGAGDLRELRRSRDRRLIESRRRCGYQAARCDDREEVTRPVISIGTPRSSTRARSSRRRLPQTVAQSSNTASARSPTHYGCGTPKGPGLRPALSAVPATARRGSTRSRPLLGRDAWRTRSSVRSRGCAVHPRSRGSRIRSR
jgi:hypothetical protein